MGIDPFLLSSSLIGVLAQRLVRVLSPDSKQPFQAGEYERRLLNLRADEPLPTLYRPGRGATGGHPGRPGGYGRFVGDDPPGPMVPGGAPEEGGERPPPPRTPPTPAAA